MPPTPINRWPAQVLLDAAHNRIDAEAPAPPPAGPGGNAALRVLKTRLAPDGETTLLSGQVGEAVQGRRTKFEGIFKLAHSEKYLLTLPNGQRLEGKEDEVATHVLLESYLREKYADATTLAGQVIGLEELDDADRQIPSRQTTAERVHTAGATASTAATAAEKPVGRVSANGLLIDQVNKAPSAGCLLFRAFDQHNAAGASHGDIVARIQKDLAQTHCKQSVSSARNRCWLRTSWLPLLTNLAPEELARKAAGMLSDPSNADTRHMPAILAAIGCQFNTDANGFLSNGERHGNDRSAILGKAVRLGGALNTVPGYTADWGRPDGESVEDYLKEMQIVIAKAIAAGEDSESLRREIDNQANPDAMAAGDMAILLHRAFNLSTIVIEDRNVAEDSNGRSPGQSHGQYLRVIACATEGSDLAGTIASWAFDDQAMPLDRLSELLATLPDCHVTWLDGLHFDTYVPHADLLPPATPATTST